MRARGPARSPRLGPPAVTEAQFTEKVLTYLRLQHWLAYHTHDSRHSEAGFPDIVAIRGPQMIVAELKKDAAHKPTDAQQKWLQAFAHIGHPSHHAVSAYVWTPDDWTEIEHVGRLR